MMREPERLGLPHRIRSDRSTPLYLDPWGSVLERAVGGEWRCVWYSIGTNEARGAPPIEIRPGQDLAIDVDVRAVGGTGIASEWSMPVPALIPRHPQSSLSFGSDPAVPP
jgi:hypothetical protein